MEVFCLWRWRKGGWSGKEVQIAEGMYRFPRFSSIWVLCLGLCKSIRLPFYRQACRRAEVCKVNTQGICLCPCMPLLVAVMNNSCPKTCLVMWECGGGCLEISLLVMPVAASEVERFEGGEVECSLWVGRWLEVGAGLE